MEWLTKIKDSAWTTIKPYVRPRYIVPFVAIILFDIIIITLVFGRAYYVSLQKVLSYIAVGSFYITSNIVAKNWKYYIPFAIINSMIVSYVFTAIFLVITFNKAPYFSDFLDIGVAGASSPLLLTFAIIGIAAVTVGIVWLNRFYETKSEFRIRTVAMSISILIAYIFPSTNTLTTHNGLKWHSFKSYAQENRNQYGDVAFAEMGIFGGMLLGSDSKNLKPLSTFKPLPYKSEYNGVFEGRNVQVILMETMDYLALNEDAMPTVYNMYENGIKFENYYVPSNHYATCRSEFQVITGKYAPPSIDCPWDNFTTYSSQIADNNIFTNFESVGYTTNYYHSTNGEYYSRNEIFKDLGMDYATFTDPNEDKDKLPTSFRDDKFADIIVEDLSSQEQYLNFWLTFDGHSPFKKDYDDKELYEKLYNRYGSSELAGLQYNNSETDKAIKKLVDAFPDDIFIMIADHNAYAIKSEVEKYRTGLDYYRTPFFIYGNGVPNVVNNTAISQFDVLPMIYDLFKINNVRALHGANPLVSNEQWFTTADGEYYKQGELVERLTFTPGKRHTWHQFLEDYSKERISMIENWYN